MSDDPKQNGANPPNGNGDASSNQDLDALLTEFKGNEPNKTSPDLSKLLKGIEPVVRFVDEARAEKETAARAKVVEESVAFIKGADELKDFDGEIVEGFLFQRYQKDAAFRSAHDNRDKDPGAWTKALAGAQESLKEKSGKMPANTVRSDLEAATAAIKGSSAKPPADTDGPSLDAKINMSDHQWQQHIERRAAAARR